MSITSDLNKLFEKSKTSEGTPLSGDTITLKDGTKAQVIRADGINAILVQPLDKMLNSREVGLDDIVDSETIIDDGKTNGLTGESLKEGEDSASASDLGEIPTGGKSKDEDSISTPAKNVPKKDFEFGSEITSFDASHQRSNGDLEVNVVWDSKPDLSKMKSFLKKTGLTLRVDNTENKDGKGFKALFWKSGNRKKETLISELNDLAKFKDIDLEANKDKVAVEKGSDSDDLKFVAKANPGTGKTA